MRNGLIGIGVVGYGYWGPNFVRNFGRVEGAQVIAICDMDATKLTLVNRHHPGVLITNEFQDLLKDKQIDAIAIADSCTHSFRARACRAQSRETHFCREATSANLRTGPPSDRRGRATKAYSDGGPHISLYTCGPKNS